MTSLPTRLSKETALPKGYGRKCGCGPKMQALKGLMKKGFAMGKKHLLPHIKEIGKSILLDALEGRKVGQSIESHTK